MQIEDMPMATKKTARRSAAKAPKEATVRFYCHGIGDCHLLKFEKEDGRDFWMLIDCGIHTSILGGSDTIRAIAQDIASVTKRIDVVVGTHEHWDHISGFHIAREIFEGIEVGEVWLGWTENPDDEQARELDKFKTKALAALQGAQTRLASSDSPHLSAVRTGIDSLLGFHFGAKGERVRAARDALEALSKKKVRYLEPAARPLTIPGLPNLRIYVMGPPRDETFISIRERASEMYGLGAAIGRANALASALHAANMDSLDEAAPFEPNMGSDLQATLGGTADPTDEGAQRARDLLHAHYLADEDRRIDMDWLGASADLAIQLDDRTNNSSLVLAFEFVDTGRVMLFTADAQVGNWLSWQELTWGKGDKAVTGPDLMSRTVLLKVGHHGSENATLEEKGLELMKDPDFSAFIPTNDKDAKKVKWGEMPFEPILDALHEHAGKRVIRADDPWPQHEPNARAPFRAPSGSVKAIRRSQDQAMWIEMDIA
jgi:glyoxylase-like metal-dependent hydrolase (beta-lactamase superfamily II)